MTIFEALGGLMHGLKIGVVQKLDSSSDEVVKQLFTEGLQKLAESTKLPPERQKRLLGLLAEVVTKMQQS